MFAFFGRFALKYKYYIIAFWVAVSAFMMIQAPLLSQVGVTDQSQFLPQQTESVYVRNLIQEKFAASSNVSSTALIVVYDANGLGDYDMNQARNLRNWLISKDGPDYISQVVSVFDSDVLRSTLVSTDNTTMMMTIGFSTPVLNDLTSTIQAIRDEFAEHPGPTFYFTGSVGFLHDLFNSVQRTIDKTTIVSIVLVIILLLIIYRSPIAALVPLFAIGMSFLITRGVIGFLAQAGISFSTVTDAYMIVTIFGVGTDYCLFIISRFREEVAQGDHKQGIVTTLQRISPIILASAVTVIIAFLCLGVSRFEMTKTSGIALAIGIAITLLIGLTLVPALMSIFGRYLFWPTKTKTAPDTKPKKNKFWGWEKTGELVSHHPLWVAIPIIVLLLLPYMYMPRLQLSANVLSQLSPDEESSVGLNVVRDHFPMGQLSPLTLLIVSKEGSLLNNNSLVGIDNVVQTLSNTKDVSKVDYPSLTATQVLTTSAQIKALAAMVTMPNFDFTKLSAIEPLATNLQGMAISYPGVIESGNYTASIVNLMQVSIITNQLHTTPLSELPSLITQLQTSLNNLGTDLMNLGNEFNFLGIGPFVDWLAANYFSTDGTVAEIKLVLSIDPFSNEASAAVPVVRDAVASVISASTLENVNAYVGGDTALYADMLTTSNDDLTIVIIVTSIGILAVIVILLRSLLTSVYMVLTVLLNYGATIGLTSWIFSYFFHYEAMINMLPVFLFVILAAVGADYNIFLVSRIREEAETRPLREAVHHAVAHTGNVITSCGIILAGTFATLASSSFPMVLEIGLAIAIGVLIDTFLVRALLVPSLAVICKRYGWWPSNLYRTMKKD
jgi:RND superfamily putative drug exporter